MALIDEVGFDTVDAGPLSESWRYQPGTSAYCVDPMIQQLPSLLQRAKRDRAPGNRDRAASIMAKLPPNFGPQETRASRAAADWSGCIEPEKLDCGFAFWLRGSAA